MNTTMTQSLTKIKKTAENLKAQIQAAAFELCFFRQRYVFFIVQENKK